MTLPHAFLHAHIKNLNFYVWSPCTRECARGRNTKGKGFFFVIICVKPLHQGFLSAADYRRQIEF